jgi:hypothetical protein
MGSSSNKIVAQPLDQFPCAAKIISDYKVAYPVAFPENTPFR